MPRRYARAAQGHPLDGHACACRDCVDASLVERRRGFSEPPEQLRLPIHPLPHLAGQPEGSTVA